VQVLLTSAASSLPPVCAGLMGYAIQRGATCMVAAVDEVVSKRSFNRLTAMIEASIWVAAGCACRDYPPVAANAVGLPSELFDRAGRRYFLDSARTSIERACSGPSRASVPASGPTSPHRLGSTWERDRHARFLASRGPPLPDGSPVLDRRVVARFAVHGFPALATFRALACTAVRGNPMTLSSCAFAAIC
jgi:hypothetical protein